MLSATLLAFLLVSLLTLVSSAPSDIQKRSFVVKRVPNPNFQGRNGPRALAKTYRKFGMLMPRELVDALEAQDTEQREDTAKPPASEGTFHHLERRNGPRRGSGAALAKSGLGGSVGGRIASSAGPARDGSTLLAQEDDVTNQTGAVPAVPDRKETEFLSPVSIGGQMVTLSFDTGSSDLWVINSQLSSAAKANHRVYDPAKSSTFSMMPDAQFRISYGDGSGAEGNVGTDVVDVGGAMVPRQPVQLATALSQTFVQDQNNDGLLGLAFSNLNTVRPQKQKTFFENVKSTLHEPLFTADLRHGSPGTFTFGAIDSSRYRGELTWIPVNTTRGFWQFGSQSFAVDGEPAQLATPGGQAIADTGTTLILADAKIVKSYYSRVPGAQADAQAGGFTVPCDAQLPDLDLDVGGLYMARVPGRDINFNPVGNSGMCFGGVQAAPAGTTAIYGDILFKSQFVVFNGGNNTLGMAPHA